MPRITINIVDSFSIPERAWFNIEDMPPMPKHFTWWGTSTPNIFHDTCKDIDITPRIADCGTVEALILHPSKWKMREIYELLEDLGELVTGGESLMVDGEGWFRFVDSDKVEFRPFEAK